MHDTEPIGGGARGTRTSRRRQVITAIVVMAGLVTPTAVLATDAPLGTDTPPAVTPTARATADTTSPTTATTIGPATTRPAVGDRPVAPPRNRPKRPSRGRPQQVTPTLPPPTTTTTMPAYLALPAGSGEGRRVVYSISRQRVWAVESNGAVVKTHAVSGKVGIPYPGTYSVFSRSERTHSIKNPNITWGYMVRFTKGPEGDNIGFHEIPTQCDGSGRCWKLQSESQLGIPLSGGCVRQSTPDAIWMWHWAQLGTKVVVLR